MEWILLSGSILVAAYFIYSAIQRSNYLREKQLENNPEYRRQEQKKIWDSTISTGEKWVEEAEAELKEAQESGNKGYIQEAKRSLAYSQSQLKMFQRASKDALSGIK